MDYCNEKCTRIVRNQGCQIGFLPWRGWGRRWILFVSNNLMTYDYQGISWYPSSKVWGDRPGKNLVYSKQCILWCVFPQGNWSVDTHPWRGLSLIKSEVLNGACNSGWCDGDNGTKPYQVCNCSFFPSYSSTVSYKPFGVSYSGASYKYTILDTSGHRSAAQSMWIEL